jgi:LAO/AO transport system kinase
VAANTSRVERVLGGDAAALARLMRDLDDGMPAGRDDLRALYPHTGRAFVVGVTGSPGVGKSTVVDGLIVRYRAAGHRVGVVAIDPSSPFSGGAILGDRIRMQRHATDDGVFIRSLATRGQLGGLTRSTADLIAVLDAADYSVILVETVGVGQAEIDVVTATDAAVVVTAPGLGDEVQALKAGILEIADVLVVNKADREGADRAVKDLTTMLDLRRRSAAPPVPLLSVVATTGQGMDELLSAIDGVQSRPALARAARRRQQAEAQLLAVVTDIMRAAVQAGVDGDKAAATGKPGSVAALVEDIMARRTDPYTAARALLSAGMLR